MVRIPDERLVLPPLALTPNLSPNALGEGSLTSSGVAIWLPVSTSAFPPLLTAVGRVPTEWVAGRG
jgi:hypothetical protein